MNAEIDTYSRYLCEKIETMLSSVEGLSHRDLNRKPNFPDANSPFVIVSHVLGSTRAWVIGIVCGQNLRRDRAAEFVAKGSYEDLAVAVKRLSTDIESALASLDPGSLDDRITPPQELWGESEAHEIPRRDGLAHMLEHAGMHLGHIHITRLLLEEEG